jgi:hypothetical protein
MGGFVERAYPSSWSFFNVLGMLVCHHFQSDASRPNLFPEEGVTSVESCNVKCQLGADYMLGIQMWWIDIRNRKLLLSACFAQLEE